MIQIAKKEVFGHFLGLGLLDRLDIAYCDSTKMFSNIWQPYHIMKDHSKITKIYF